jgi:protein-disulfide isomerase
MENKVRASILAVAVGIFAGVAVIFALNSMIQTAMVPVVGELQVISAKQDRLDRELKMFANKETAGAIVSLNRELQALKAMAGNRPPAAPREQGPDLNKVYDIPVGASPVQGKADAPVTIVQFVDFQCPFCARFYPPVKEVLKAFPDQVRMVIKNFPLNFHREARSAAKAVLAAGLQGKYYEMADLILTSNMELTGENFKAHAAKIGLNVEKFSKDLKDQDAAFEKAIQADMELAARVGVRGTPSFYLNGRITSARAFEQWKAAVEAALKEPAGQAAGAPAQGQ